MFGIDVPIVYEKALEPQMRAMGISIERENGEDRLMTNNRRSYIILQRGKVGDNRLITIHPKDSNTLYLTFLENGGRIIQHEVTRQGGQQGSEKVVDRMPW